jgi:anti-sigma factor RsiW
MTHPDDATLQNWFDRELPPPDASAVDEHLAGCSACTARVDGLARLGDALGAWAEAAPLDFDVTAAVLARVGAEGNGMDVSPPATVTPLGAARARRSPGRAMLYPAFAAAAAMVLFLVWRSPNDTDFRKLPAPAPDPAAQTVPVGGGAGGAEVTSVDVQGAQSFSVLEIPGVSPGATTAVVWIQDSPEESPTPPTNP